MDTSSVLSVFTRTTILRTKRNALLVLSTLKKKMTHHTVVLAGPHLVSVTAMIVMMMVVLVVEIDLVTVTVMMNLNVLVDLMAVEVIVVHLDAVV